MTPRDLDEPHDGAVRVRAVLVGLMVLSAFLMAGMGLLAWMVGVWAGSILAGAGVALVLCWAVELWGDECRRSSWPRGWDPVRDRIVPSSPTRAARPSADWFEEFAAAAGWREVPPAPIPCFPSGRRWPVKGGRRPSPSDAKRP